MEGIIKFLTAIGKLKRTRRTGWVQRKVSDPEAVSGHMYRMAIIAMVTADKDLDKEKCIKLCLVSTLSKFLCTFLLLKWMQLQIEITSSFLQVHDMAECIVGDTAPSDNIPKKQKQGRFQHVMWHCFDKYVSIFSIFSICLNMAQYVSSSWV